MADATQNLPVTWDSGSHSTGVVKPGIAVIREGALVSRLAATGEFDHGGDDAGVRFAGVALEEGLPGEVLRVRTIGVFGPYAFLPGSADASHIGLGVALVDDQTVDLAGNTTHAVKCGAIYAVDSPAKVRVKIEGAALG